MADSALGAIANVVGGVAAGVGQSVMNQQAARQQQQYTRENMEQAQRNQLQLMRLATPMAAQGVRDAGGSIANMNGPMSPNSAGGAPAGAAVAPVDAANIMKSMTENRLLNAQAEKQEIENNRLVEEDSVAKDAYLKQLKQQINLYRSSGLNEPADNLQAQYDGISDGSVKFNVGTFAANLKAIEAHSRSLESFTNEIRSLLSQVGTEKLLRTRPGIEADLTLQKLALDAAQAYYLNSSGAEAQQRLSEIEAHTKNLYQDINLKQSQGKLTDIQARQIKNQDINTLLEDGEIGAAVRAGLVSGGQSFVHGFGQGAGVVAAAKMGGLAGLAGSASGGSLVTRNMLGTAAKRAANPIAKSGIDRDTFEALSKRIGYDKALTLYNGYVADPHRKYGSYKGFNDWLTKNNNGHGWRK